MTKTIGILVVLACVLAAVPAAALAKAPPEGNYYCTFYDHSTHGTLNITSKKKYGWHNGKRGRYSTKGHRIKFRSGPMKGAYEHAEWRRHGKTVWINLFDGRE